MPGKYIVVNGPRESSDVVTKRDVKMYIILNCFN